MKKPNCFLVLCIPALLLILSYALDKRVSLLLQNARFAYLDFALSIVTNFSIAVFVMLIIPSIILYKHNKKSVYALLLAFIVSFILAFAIKLIVLRERPIEAFAYPFTSIVNYSFPSMHSMAVFSLLPLLISYLPKQKIFWAAFAFLVSFSRIYFGFHFLSDVVFGAVAGYMIGYFLLTQKFSPIAKIKEIYERTKNIRF